MNVRKYPDNENVFFFENYLSVLSHLSDKDLGEICKKDCEDIYVDCIQRCGDSDCYMDCGRDLSYCSDGECFDSEDTFMFHKLRFEFRLSMLEELYKWMSWLQKSSLHMPGEYGNSKDVKAKSL